MNGVVLVKELTAKSNEELRTVLSELLDQVHPVFGDKLKKAVLFGSYARGNYDAESDIDVMLMIDEDKNALKRYFGKITDIVVELDLKHDVVLAPILLSEKNLLNINMHCLFILM